jgi:hypothetical protein
MNLINKEEWNRNCEKEIATQIMLNRLKKEGKVKKNEAKKIQEKINKIGYSNFLNSPHFFGKEELKKKALILCIEDYCASVGFSDNYKILFKQEQEK